MIENFDKLTYERKVDVLVAMYVFRIKDIIIEHIDWSYGDGNYYKVYTKSLMVEDYISCYSTLLTNAWDVVRKFDYLYLFRSAGFKRGQWECKLYDRKGVLKIGETNEYNYYGWAETEQLAICYAGLKAVGFDVQAFLKEEGKNDK